MKQQIITIDKTIFQD